MHKLVDRSRYIFYCLFIFLAGCVSVAPHTDTMTEQDASSMTVEMQKTAWSALPGWHSDDMQSAWAAYHESCLALTRRGDKVWKALCDAAKHVDAIDGNAIRAYFEAHFQPMHLRHDDGSAVGLITGYYEPILQGSRKRGGIYQTPLYLYPRGVTRGQVLPPRAKLLSGALALEPLVYVDDPVEAAFLQIQGSGRVRLAEGGEMRVGFAGSNEQPFKSIGRWLLDRGEVTPAQATMQGIKAWGRAHPNQCEAMLNINPRFVFFRELPSNGNAGSPGALGVPLSPERSLAVDPAYIPLGSPVFISTTWPLSTQRLQRLMFAQDTGGAIKGRVRADFYWGTGFAAGELAGRMKEKGELWVLLPRLR